MSWTELFGGQNINPAQLSYREVVLSGNTTLVWPLEAQVGAPIAAEKMDVSPTAGGFWLRLPDARLASVGEDFYVINTGLDSFDLQSNTGVALVTLDPGNIYLVYLTDNSTQTGVWRAAQITASASVAPVDASYVLMGLNGTLTNERILTTSSTIEVVDGGAGQPVTLEIVDESVTNAMLADMEALSVKVNPLAIVGAPQNLAASALGQVLKVNGAGNALIWGLIDTTNIAADAVAYSQIQPVSATDRFLGRISPGAGDIEELTAADAMDIIGLFSNVLDGLVPASGGGTANYLRADATFQNPFNVATITAADLALEMVVRDNLGVPKVITVGDFLIDVAPIPIIVACGDETTPIAGTGVVVTFRMPYRFMPLEVRASLTVASSTGDVEVDILEGGVSILSTEITIEEGETTSLDAAVQPVISDADLADDAEMTVSITAAGVDAAGLKVTIIGIKIT